MLHLHFSKKSNSIKYRAESFYVKQGYKICTKANESKKTLVHKIYKGKRKEKKNSTEPS